MSERFRKIDTKLRSDERFRRLSKPKPNAQSLYLHLVSTGHDRSIPGLLTVGLGQLADELEWTQEDVARCFGEIETEGLAIADWPARVIWLPETIQHGGHNEPKSWKNVTAWSSLWREVPDCELKWRAFTAAAAYLKERDDDQIRSKTNEDPQFLNTLIAELPVPSHVRTAVESLRKKRVSKTRSQPPSKTRSPAASRPDGSEIRDPRSEIRDPRTKGERATPLVMAKRGPWVAAWGRGVDLAAGLLPAAPPGPGTAQRDEDLGAHLVRWEREHATRAWVEPQAAEWASKAFSRRVRAGREAASLDRIARTESWIDELMLEGETLFRPTQRPSSSSSSTPAAEPELLELTPAMEWDGLALRAELAPKRMTEADWERLSALSYELGRKAPPRPQGLDPAPPDASAGILVAPQRIAAHSAREV